MVNMTLKWEDLDLTKDERVAALIHHITVSSGDRNEPDYYKDLMHDFLKRRGHHICRICGEELKEEELDG